MTSWGEGIVVFIGWSGTCDGIWHLDSRTRRLNHPATNAPYRRAGRHYFVQEPVWAPMGFVERLRHWLLPARLTVHQEQAIDAFTRQGIST